MPAALPESPPELEDASRRPGEISIASEDTGEEIDYPDSSLMPYENSPIEEEDGSIGEISTPVDQSREVSEHPESMLGDYQHNPVKPEPAAQPDQPAPAPNPYNQRSSSVAPPPRDFQSQANQEAPAAPQFNGQSNLFPYRGAGDGVQPQQNDPSSSGLSAGDTRGQLQQPLNQPLPNPANPRVKTPGGSPSTVGGRGSGKASQAANKVGGEVGGQVSDALKTGKDAAELAELAAAGGVGAIVKGAKMLASKETRDRLKRQLTQGIAKDPDAIWIITCISLILVGVITSVILVIVGLAGPVGLTPPGSPLVAASLTDGAISDEFNPNMILSDTAFAAKDTMTPADIQAFLVKHKSPLATADPSTLGADANGRSAAQIIYDATRNNPPLPGLKAREAVSVNPQLMLVELNKEEGLITSSTNKLQHRLDRAIGYGCPDRKPCSAKYNGFTRQVYYGSENLMHTLAQAQKGNTSYKVGRTYSINSQVNPSPVRVTILNAATAAFYTYTPWVRDGNYNIWRMMNLYFRSSLITKAVTSYHVKGTGKMALPLNPSVAFNFGAKVLHNCTVSIPDHCQNVPGQTYKGHQVILGSLGSYGTYIPSRPASGEGVDLGVPAGTPVYAPFDGIITKIGCIRKGCLDAKYVVMESLDGHSYAAALLHVDNITDKKVVKAGEQIATISGKPSFTHLHFELWAGTTAVNAGTAAQGATVEKIWAAQKKALGF